MLLIVRRIYVILGIFRNGEKDVVGTKEVENLDTLWSSLHLFLNTLNTKRVFLLDQICIVVILSPVLEAKVVTFYHSLLFLIVHWQKRTFCFKKIIKVINRKQQMVKKRIV